MTLANTRIAAAVFAGIAGTGGAAIAAPIDWDAAVKLDVLLGGAAQDAPFNETPFVGRLDIGVSGEHIFANGAVLRVAFAAAAERDQPRRDPRGGRAGDCPPNVAICPNIAGRSVRGYFSGFTPGGPIADRQGRAALQSAYAALSGGYGEISVGRDEGVAARFSAVPGNILFGGSLLQGSVDLTGLGGLAARNDISGQSFKVSVLSPRILGIRLGGGWTPSLESQGVDQGYVRSATAPAVAQPRNIAEFGASFEHAWRNGVSARFSGTYATGGNASGFDAFGRLTSWSYGGALSRGNWTLGVERLGSDNASRANQRGYRATTASILYEKGPWTAQASGGKGRDDLALVGLSTASIGARRTLAKSLSLLAGLTVVERRVPGLAGNGLATGRERSLALFTGLSFAL